MSALLLDYFSEHGGRAAVSVPKHKHGKQEIEVIEVRKQVDDGSVTVETLHLDTEAIQRHQQSVDQPGYVVTLRVACVALLPVQPPGYLDVEPDCYTAFLRAYELQQVQDLAYSGISTFDLLSVDPSDESAGVYCSLHVAHYIGLFFIGKDGMQSTNGLCWCGLQGLPRLKAAIKRMAHLAEHPLYLLLATVTALTAVQELRLAEISGDISSVENRTGHATNYNVTHPAAKGSFDQLSAQMSGAGTAIAANKRLERVLMMLLDRMEEHDRKAPQAVQVAFYTDVLRKRIQNHLVLIDLYDARVQSQVTACFNLIARDEMKLSISVAEDSRKIASATKHDSTSMKILAAITVFFLPGTFTASLFSMSMFQWEIADNTVVSSQFWVYWATTIPLTLLTIVLCVMLIRRWQSAAQSDDKQITKNSAHTSI